MQGKILAGEVERKAYMRSKHELARLKSAVSSVSGTNSAKSTLSKAGSRLTHSLMPMFVSPRKIKEPDEPKYKVYFEPPLLPKRLQTPNPSFFAGSNDEYKLPERLPDVIEFTDSKRVDVMEKQLRCVSSMSIESSVGVDDSDPLDRSENITGRSDKLESTKEEAELEHSDKKSGQQEVEHLQNPIQSLDELGNDSVGLRKLRAVSAPNQPSQPLELEQLNRRSESVAAEAQSVLCRPSVTTINNPSDGSTQSLPQATGLNEKQFVNDSKTEEETNEIKDLDSLNSKLFLTEQSTESIKGEEFTPDECVDEANQSS